jgi:SAM-dependent methyltransferase
MKPSWVPVTVHLPGWVYRPAKRLRKAISRGERRGSVERKSSISGERAVEWSFISAHMPLGPGEVLDFGPEYSHLGLIAARRGFKVTALDLEPHPPLWEHEGVGFVQGDVLKLELPSRHFAVVINCSSIEHVGLAGRYGAFEERLDGDLDAMTKMREAMIPGGVMLLTTPVGNDAVFHPLHRVYGPERLPRLLQGFNVERSEFWVKSDGNRWHLCTREAALSFEAYSLGDDAQSNAYALGCFVIRRPE